MQTRRKEAKKSKWKTTLSTGGVKQERWSGVTAGERREERDTPTQEMGKGHHKIGYTE